MTPLTIPAPTPARIVLYRTDGRTGLVYDLPAVVTVTRDSHPGDYPCERCGSDDASCLEHIAMGSGEWCCVACRHPKNPLPVPSSPGHVHLTVFTPGFGLGAPMPSSDPFAMVAGDHRVELDVPPAADPDFPDPRTWRWPPRMQTSIVLGADGSWTNRQDPA